MGRHFYSRMPFLVVSPHFQWDLYTYSTSNHVPLCKKWWWISSGLWWLAVKGVSEYYAPWSEQGQKVKVRWSLCQIATDDHQIDNHDPPGHHNERTNLFNWQGFQKPKSGNKCSESRKQLSWGLRKGGNKVRLPTPVGEEDVTLLHSNNGGTFSTDT